MKRTICIILLCALLIGCISLGFFIYANSQKVDEELIATLINYLQMRNAESVPKLQSFENDMNMLKLSGQIDNEFQAQAFRVKINPTNCYYVCAYLNVQHSRESGEYCGYSNYRWVKFSNAKDILEYDDGEKLIVAFQINRTIERQHVMPIWERVPSISFFQIYYPQFVDGHNVEAINRCDETLIITTRLKKDHLYFTKDDFYVRILPSVVLDGICYLTEKLYVDSPSGDRYSYSVKGRLGKYYDVLMEMMITDKYTEIDECGNTIHYGLFNLKDIINTLVNWEE